jgi:hypothetical protein
VLGLVRLLTHVSGWYLGTEADRTDGRIMRSLLSSGLTALGLVRTPERRG